MTHSVREGEEELLLLIKNNETTYKNVLTYLDGIWEHNNVITYIVNNELSLHKTKTCESFRDERINVKSFF